MSSILSIILVIVMAFSSMAGMTAGIEDTVSFDAKISADVQTVMAMSGDSAAADSEETQQIAKVAGDIVEALTLKGVATKDTAELDLIAGEKDVVLSIGVKNDENGTTVASSLLSSDVIFISAETLQQLEQQMQSGSSVPDMAVLQQLQGLDKEQIEKDSEEFKEKLKQALEAKKGEAETGTFSVDGLSFTARARVDMTYAEFSELFLTLAKELAGKDSLKPLFQATGSDVEAEIDKAIEELKKQTESDWPEQFDLTVYTDADNCAYYVCDMAQKPKTEYAKEERMHLGLGTVDGLDLVNAERVQGDEKINAAYAGAQGGAFKLSYAAAGSGTDMEVDAEMSETGNLDATCLIKSATPNAKFTLHTEPADGERTGFEVALYAGDSAAPMISVKGSVGKGGEVLSVYEGETLNVIPIETLMNDSDGTVASQLQMKLIAGLLKAITTVTKNVPEDTAKWITTQVQQMMNPSTNE